MATSETTQPNPAPVPRATLTTTPGRATPAPTLSGRQLERDVIDGHLRETKAGRGSVLLIEGRAGLGKSRLLEEAVACADVDGFRVGTAVASPLDHPIAMAPLLTALFDGAEPLLDRGPLADRVALEPSFWSVSQVATELERAAQRQPLLLCIDDVHAVERETAAALGILTQRLLGSPVLWILSVRPHAPTRAVADLVALLERHGASKLTLETLDEAAGRSLTAELLGAEPSAQLLELASQAAGVPATIVDLARGLIDEGLVRREDGRVELVESRLPQRIGDRVRSAMTATSAQARLIGLVAAVQGTHVAIDHVAAMLDVAPASLLTPIDELVRADVMSHDGRSLGFRSELVRQALTEPVAPSVIRTLRLQAIEVLLAAGASPLQPARDLAATGSPSDRAAITTLTAAAHGIGAIDPDLAAQLCRRAFDVTTVGDEWRPALACDLATFLHDSGQAEQAKEIVETVAREPLAPDDEAVVRLAASRMLDLAPKFRVGAGQAAMARHGVTARWRAAHAAELILNHLDDGHPDAASALLSETTAFLEASRDVLVSRVPAIARARLRATDGDLELAHADLKEAGSTLAATAQSGGWQAELFRGELLLALGKHDDLQPLVSAALDAAQRAGQVVRARSWRRMHARVLMQRGQLTESADILASDLADHRVAATPDDARALLTMCELAIHAGDDRRAKALAAIAEHSAEDGGPAVRSLTTWLLARHAETSNNSAGTRACLARLSHERDAARLPVLTLEPNTAPQLVRMAQHAGLDELAEAAAAAANDLARRNPSAPCIAAVASHCRGLIAHDAAALASAAERFGQASLIIAQASALEDLGAELAQRTSAGPAIEALDDALRHYSRCAATWDASRVRQRLRALGVRRRLLRTSRPTNGWASLTAAELAVVRLVADGLTNRAVARHLFVSSHTVSMHLRHAFLKLDINSRVELTRLAVDNLA